jgi:hypothetical protein
MVELLPSGFEATTVSAASRPIVRIKMQIRPSRYRIGEDP